MSKWYSIILAGLVALGFSLNSLAQPGPAVDCTKARDPQRCEARQKARDACKDKPAAQRRQCIQEQMPPPDCSKARNPQRCTALQAGRQACKGKAGADYRQCLRAQGKSPAPAAKP